MTDDLTDAPAAGALPGDRTARTGLRATAATTATALPNDRAGSSTAGRGIAVDMDRHPAAHPVPAASYRATSMTAACRSASIRDVSPP
jgi:hypothetical protein